MKRAVQMLAQQLKITEFQLSEKILKGLITSNLIELKSSDAQD